MDADSPWGARTLGLCVGSRMRSPWEALSLDGILDALPDEKVAEAAPDEGRDRT